MAAVSTASPTGSSPGPDHGASGELARPNTAGLVRFGNYTLITELGHGGMADVFLAVYSGQVTDGFNKLTVIKRLRANLAEDADCVTMLVDEARLAARLNHPNVVQTNEIGKVGEQYFIAMEYLDGQPLNRIITRAKKSDEKRLSQQMALTILCEVLAGLHYAHELADYDGTPLNIVHRDVSPQNVFVTYAGQVKMVDFGIAKAAGRTAETREGIVKGKIAYMAPEQPLGGQIDRRVDVFAVGVMLYELLAGTRLWNGLDDLAIFQRLFTNEVPRSPRAVEPSVPEELDRICQKALAPKAGDRYPTALAMQADIEAYLRGNNANASGRELGAYVSAMFADKRTELGKVIESRLATLQTRPSLPEFTPEMSLGGTDATPYATSSPTVIATVEQQERVERGGPRRGPPIFAIGAVLALVVAVTGALYANRSPSTPTADVAASSAGEPRTQVEKLQLILRASPSEARFRIDDGPLLDNPHVSSMPRDGSVHTVTAEAPGYRSQTVEVSYAGNVVLDLTLERLPTQAKAEPTPAPAAPASAATARRQAGARATAPQEAPPPPGQRRSLRPIDSELPW